MSFSGIWLGAYAGRIPNCPLGKMCQHNKPINSQLMVTCRLLSHSGGLGQIMNEI